MHVDWLLLGKAVCLVAVIEGLLFALAPQRMRAAAAMISQQNERSLRFLGLISMLIGAACLMILA